MAESDLEKNAEFSQVYGRNHDGEDPRVAAQRLLNIFRQLHIFSAHKRQEFNGYLLKQPMPVKKALAALPGGSLVLEYINELEEEAGVQTDTSLLKSSKENIQREIQSVESHDEIAQVKILAKALSEAQFSSAALAPDEVRNISKNLQEKFDTLKREIENKISSFQVVSSDGKSVTLQNDNSEAIAKAIREAAQNISKQQEQLAKIRQDFMLKFSGWADTNQEIIQAIASHKESEKNNYQDNASAKYSQPIVPFDFEAIITQIAEKQAEMFKEFSKQQADSLGAILSNVLKENNSASLKVIEQALQTFQTENARLLEIQTNLKNSMPSLKNEDENSELADDEINPSANANVVTHNLQDDEQKGPNASKKKNKKKNKQKESDNISFAAQTTKKDGTDFTENESFVPDETDTNVDDTNASQKTSSVEDGGDDEYVWEYVDDTQDTLSNDDGDYVWEYVDEDDASEGDGEYVWEYVDDDSSVEENAPQAPLTQLDTVSAEKSNVSHQKLLEPASLDDEKKMIKLSDDLSLNNVLPMLKLSGVDTGISDNAAPYPKPVI